MPRTSPRRALVLSLVIVAVCTAPTLGYVIFLKDGNQITIREKYRVEGDQAIFSHENGVIGSIPLVEIDVALTEKENLVQLRGVQTIQGLEKVDLANVDAPPPKRDTLSDLLRRKGETGSISLPEPRLRNEDAGQAPSSGQSAAAVPRTAAGFVDLLVYPRRPFADSVAREALAGLIADRGLEMIGIFEGTAPRQPFIELVAGTESAVFAALTGTARVLLEIRATHPDAVEAVELLMRVHPSGDNRSGQFQLTPELAELLVSGGLTPAAFFLRYVEF